MMNSSILPNQEELASSLKEAISLNHTEQLYRLIDQGVDLSNTNYSLIEYAKNKHDLQLLEHMMKHQEKMFLSYPKMNDLIIQSAEDGHLFALAWILDKTHQFNPYFHKPSLPFLWPEKFDFKTFLKIKSDWEKFVKTSIIDKIHHNSCPTYNEALKRAAINGHLSCVQRLLQYGAEFSVALKYGSPTIQDWITTNQVKR